MDAPADSPSPSDPRWERRIARERQARIQAEDLLEAKSLALYEAHQSLLKFAADLERRVEERTRELEAAREHAVTLSERDQLTGLANRMRFGRSLLAARQRHMAEQRRFALLLIDIDRFKQINDTLGHDAGDAVLKSLAQRLIGAMGDDASIARLGGDEFAVVFTAFEGLDDLAAAAERIITVARQPVCYADRSIQGSCSIGVAVCPDDMSDVADLQRYADFALYKAKALGRDRAVYFDSALRTEFERLFSLGAELKGAIARGEIVPFFQPIVAGSTGTMVGVEVLARWLHPERGMLMPNHFIKLAEDNGLMGALFAHQLRAACLITKRWIDDGTIRYLSVNVSPSQFRTGGLVDTVFATLADIGFDAHALTVEITEEVLLLDLDRASFQLDQLARGGVSISLDDFGAGYSNIAYLRRLPINTLKIDRLLTADVCTDQRARSVIKAVVEIARALDLSLVAEGVETHAQARWLSQLGCEFLQGYFYGKPQSERTLVDQRDDPQSHLLQAM